MRAYSNDLRERIVAAVARGDYPLRHLARLFAVSLSFLIRLLQRHRRTGAVRPEPHAGGPTPKRDAAAQARLRALVRDQPDATRAELRTRLGVSCSLMTIARALKRHRLTRKQKTAHADERDSPDVQAKRAAFDERMATVDPARLVFVDEMGANTAMTRTPGRAPAGVRVEATTPGQWENVTLIVGMRQGGVVAPWAFQGATDQPAFQTYVRAVLVPELHRGDVVVWDNLKPHQDGEALQALQAVGGTVEPLPPYSPDKTPSEEMFSKAKGSLRSVAARTTETVIAARGAALDLITPTDICGWFQDRAAYAMH